MCIFHFFTKLLDNIAFSLFGFDVYWYGVLYFLSTIIVILSVINSCHYFNLSSDVLKKMVNFSILNIIIFARIFDVFVYNFDDFLYNPYMILFIRDGGLSFHGGLIGLICYTLYASRKYKFSFLSFADCVSVFVPIAILFVRIGNFINSELIGVNIYHVMNQKFYNIFIYIFRKFYDFDLNNVYAIDYGDGILRYPCQLYEAFLEGIGLLFISLILLYFKVYYRHYANQYLHSSYNFKICNSMKIFAIGFIISDLCESSLYYFISKYYVVSIFILCILILLVMLLFNLIKNIYIFSGSIFGMFLIFYGKMRFFCENFREPEVLICDMPLGKIFSIIMICIGVGIVLKNIINKRI